MFTCMRELAAICGESNRWPFISSSKVFCGIRLIICVQIQSSIRNNDIICMKSMHCFRESNYPTIEKLGLKVQQNVMQTLLF